MSQNEVFGTAAQLSSLLECTERSIQQLAKDGMLPKAQRGKYPLFPCVTAYVRHQRKLIEGNGDLTLTDERKRLTRAQADESEFKLQVSKGNYIHKNALADILGRVLSTFRDRVLALPTKLAPRVIGKKSLPGIKEILSKAVNECLNELSGFKARGLVGSNGHSGNGKAAAKADGERVGGRKTTVKS